MLIITNNTFRNTCIDMGYTLTSYDNRLMMKYYYVDNNDIYTY